MEISELLIGDCLEYLKSFSDNQFDIVITDPPYGINENSIRTKSRGTKAKPTDYGEFSWDKEPISKEYFQEIKRVSKNQVIFGGNYYCEYLGNTSCFLVWDKLNAGGFADCELAWTSFPTATRLIKCRWHGMIQYNMKQKEKRYHPTQKPIPVMTWIIENYTKKGETIFDPFCGSGTTGVSAAILGRNFIGIDKEKKYIEIAKKRIDEAKMQLQLF